MSPSAYSSGDAFTSEMEQLYSCAESDLKTLIQKHWAENCPITIMGHHFTPETLPNHIKAIREGHDVVKFTSKRFVKDGNLVAEKHYAIGHRKDGTTTEAEVWVMVELDEEGRAVEFEEIMRVTVGSLEKEFKAKRDI
ncbi:hypothetical protein NQ176_g8647 [Zarea fungicola]|uniref:Uncharacterized protein n=1 Tax=Zarea fungicola TaxID=93591 RepID=A0ACC1MS74_9HYPO|nr:hypothetical protein NQ176_g8647 [Lecanicillium fungicola]